MIRLVEESAAQRTLQPSQAPRRKAVTERAYDNPVFVEDLVATSPARRRHPEITWFRVEAENFESIHNHNAYAVIEGGKSGNVAG